MRDYEKHPTIKGCYITHDAKGYAFRVSPAHPGWQAIPSHAAKHQDLRRHRADKLADVVAKVRADDRA
jgi:hypothetical protein